MRGRSQGREERSGCCYIMLRCHQWVRRVVGFGPDEAVAAWVCRGAEEAADAAEGIVDSLEVVCHPAGAEEMVAILSVGEVVAGEVCTGQDQLVIDSV